MPSRGSVRNKDGGLFCSLIWSFLNVINKKFKIAFCNVFCRYVTYVIPKDKRGVVQDLIGGVRLKPAMFFIPISSVNYDIDPGHLKFRRYFSPISLETVAENSEKV